MYGRCHQCTFFGPWRSHGPMPQARRLSIMLVTSRGRLILQPLTKQSMNASWPTRNPFRLYNGVRTNQIFILMDLLFRPKRFQSPTPSLQHKAPSLVLPRLFATQACSGNARVCCPPLSLARPHKGNVRPARVRLLGDLPQPQHQVPPDRFPDHAILLIVRVLAHGVPHPAR